MSRKKTFVFIGIGVAKLMTVMGIIITAIIIAAVIWLNGGNLPSARIELPNVEMVTRIEMEQFDSGNSNGVAVTENHSDIDTLLSALSEAKRASLTWVSASNDTPAVSNFLTIQIYDQQKRWFRFSLYTDGSSEYVYLAYSGIYKIDPKLSAEIYQMYDTLLTNAVD